MQTTVSEISNGYIIEQMAPGDFFGYIVYVLDTYVVCVLENIAIAIAIMYWHSTP